MPPVPVSVSDPPANVIVPALPTGELPVMVSEFAPMANVPPVIESEPIETDVVSRTTLPVLMVTSSPGLGGPLVAGFQLPLTDQSFPVAPVPPTHVYDLLAI